MFGEQSRLAVTVGQELHPCGDAGVTEIDFFAVAPSGAGSDDTRLIGAACLALIVPLTRIDGATVLLIAQWLDALSPAGHHRLLTSQSTLTGLTVPAVAAGLSRAFPLAIGGCTTEVSVAL